MATTYECRFVGVTPFIMDADNFEEQEKLEEWIREHPEESKKGDDRTPPWRWKLKFHTDDVQVVVPCDMVIAAIAGAGNEIPKTGRGRKSYKYEALHNICPLDDYHPILVGTKRKKPVLVADITEIEGSFVEQMAAVRDLGFRLFVKRARPRGTSRHIRVRPRFEEYEFTVRLCVTGNTISRELLTQIVNRMDSWGNWSRRQTKPGPFGKTKAILKEIKK